MRDASRLHGASLSGRLCRRPRSLAPVLLAVLATLFESLPTGAQRDAQRKPLTDEEVKQAVIRESLAQYPGPCPCPYNIARNGSRCGMRSAYSRPGGEEPICYERNVTSWMVAAWRRRHDTLH